MGSKSGSTVPVTDYRYSIHMGICHGPVDSINKIVIGDKTAWCGYESGQSDIDINLPDLFGGDKKEGGPVGIAEFYPGSLTQLATSELASRRGKTPSTTPAGRGVASVFFRGKSNNGFKWMTNNPYMPSTEISVTRLPKQLSATYSSINPIASAENPIPVAPVHTGILHGINLGLTLVGESLIDDEPNNGSGEVYPIQGQYMDWQVWGASNPSSWSNYSDGLGIAIGYGTIVKDFRLIDLGITDYEMDNGAVTVELSSTGRQLNTWAHSIRDRLYAIPEDVNGLPDATGAVQIAVSTAGPTSDTSDNTWALSAVLPAGTKWVRWSQYHIPFGAGGLYWKKADVNVTWEEYSLSHCAIASDPAAGLGALPNANPAHMHYELFTDSMIGKGFAPSIMDTAKYMGCAETLYNEGFGLFMVWVNRGDVITMLNEIQSHISATSFTNLRTGLVEMKLLRDDYDIGTLRTLDETNSVISNFHRRTISETTNEIVVKWTNPVTEESETVRAQDLGNIAEQGGVVTTERDYYGIRDSQLAMRVAQRDLAVMSATTASFNVSASREFWDVNPGDVLLVDSADDGVTGLVARVNKVGRGEAGAYPITMECVEDVFGLEAATYVEQPLSGWVPESVQPVVFTNVEIQTAPWALMSRAGVDPDAEYPRVMGIVAAEKPSRNTVSFDLFAPTVDAGGTTVVTNRGEMFPTDYAELVDAWAPEGESLVTSSFYSNFVGIEGPETGSLAIIGAGETAGEIVLFKSYNPNNGAWTISRGMLDTVPKAWPISTPVWFLNSHFNALDQVDMSVSEALDYQLRSSSTSSNLDLFFVPVVQYTMSDRPSLPFRPANVKINGVGFTDIQLEGVDAAITWSERDRLAEDGVLSSWSEGTVTPESGQTTAIVFYNAGGTNVLSYSGLTGISLDVTFATLALLGEDFLYMEVAAARDGLTSLQVYKQTLEIITLAKVSQQTEYVVTGLGADAASVSQQTEYVVTGLGADAASVSQQTEYIIQSVP